MCWSHFLGVLDWVLLHCRLTLGRIAGSEAVGVLDLLPLSLVWRWLLGLLRYLFCLPELVVAETMALIIVIISIIHTEQGLLIHYRIA